MRTSQGFAEDEKHVGYEWMYCAFMEAVQNVAPAVLFTDADPAVTSAVLTVFGEDTLHFWCIWHIYQNLDKKFKGSIPDYKGVCHLKFGILLK
jgi:hypothetical protein